jgi:hypothetical protein
MTTGKPPRRRPSRAAQRERDRQVALARGVVGLLSHPWWRLVEILCEARECTVGKPEVRAGLVETGRTLIRLGKEIEMELGRKT